MVDDQLRIDGAMSRLVSDSMCLRPYSLSVLSAGKLDIARLWVRLDHHAAPRHRAVAWRRIAAVKFDVIELVDRALTHRSEEHTSELQSLMRISYAVFCLKKKK